MLNKQICIRCCNNNGFPWNKKDSIWLADEEDWNDGYVTCPSKHHNPGNVDVCINEPPHDKCPYALEHLMGTLNGNTKC